MAYDPEVEKLALKCYKWLMDVPYNFEVCTTEVLLTP